MYRECEEKRECYENNKRLLIFPLPVITIFCAIIEKNYMRNDNHVKRSSSSLSFLESNII